MIYSFKNGIEITIPDEMPNLFNEWAGVKVAMSLILNPPLVTAVPSKERKPYDMTSWTEKRKRKTSKAVKAWHRMNKKT